MARPWLLSKKDQAKRETGLDLGLVLASYSPAQLMNRLEPEEYRVPKHLELLSHEIAKCMQEPRRLLIHAPVRHGKSELVSRGTPTWWFFLEPKDDIAIVSHGSDFARLWGRRIKDTIDENPQLKLKIRPDASAQNSWELNTGGSLHTVGIGGSITGRGFNLIVVDDPIKNDIEAYSQYQRDRIWNWFSRTLMTRLHPKGSVIVLMSRWHQDDLAGRLTDGWGEQYDHVSIPAIYEKRVDPADPDIETSPDIFNREFGEALWPEMWPVEELEKHKKAVGSLIWQAQYQGRPTTPGGTLFKRENWRYIDLKDVPEGVADIRGYDFGASEDVRTGDPTASVLMRRCFDGRIIVMDAEQYWMTPGARNKRIQETAQIDTEYTRISIPDDPGQSGSSQVEDFKQNVLPGFFVMSSPETGSKAVRSFAYAAQVEHNNVYLVKGTWNKAYVDEHADMTDEGTTGDHDDQVDASSRAYNSLLKIRIGHITDLN